MSSPTGQSHEMKDAKRRRFIRTWLPVGLYCLLIFIQSSFPSAVQTPRFPFADKLLHGLVYAVLGVLFLRAFKVPETPYRTAAIRAVAATTLYGISDEIHQFFVPSRSAELTDVIADGIGSLLGVLLFILFWAREGMSASRKLNPKREFAD